MRKTIVIAMVVALTGSLALVGCGEPSATEPAATEPAPTARVEPAPIPPRDRSALATTTPVPVPAPAPAPAIDERPTSEARAELRVRRLVVTRGVEGREPIDEIDVLDREEDLERVYAFVDASNAGEGEGELEVSFERDDGFVTGMVTLDVPARAGRHRTWAFTRGVRAEGAWRAVVRDQDGRVLAEQPFDVQ